MLLAWSMFLDELIMYYYDPYNRLCYSVWSDKWNDWDDSYSIHTTLTDVREKETLQILHDDGLD